MGTSLKVHGLKKVVRAFAKAVHARNGMVVFVNATPPSKEWEGVIDYHVEGDTDIWVERVEEEWRRIRPQDWETQTTLDGGMEVVKHVIKPQAKGKGKAADKRGFPGTRYSFDPDCDLPATAETNAEPVQLPTPRPSQSPIKSPASSPLTTLPPSSPTPLSPSKRRANMPPSPVSEGGSPMKKRIIPLSAPSTGLPGTPGKGNLFASPTATNVVTPTADDEVFGTLVKPVAKAKSTGKTMTKTKTKTGLCRISGKENVRPIKGAKAALNRVRSATKAK